jgi:hypothetical protein
MKKIKLTNSNKFALVDDSLFEYFSQWPWHLSTHGYAVRTQYVNPEKSFAVYMHHHVVGHTKMTDHWDGDKLNNQFLNLRLTNMSQNKMNAGPHRDNTSGYKGVCWSKQHKKWLVQICANGKKMHGGIFKDKIEAAKKYDAMAREHHGVYARLNFPEEK